ncbi:tol-pal system protein YbgF [bacterium]|nr:MAG: tol-pal system protein YbgF [bacterium]
MKIHSGSLTKTALAACLLSALTLGGCVTVDQNQASTTSREDIVAKLQEEVQVLKRAVDEHNTRQATEVALSERVAQLGARVDQMDQEVKALKGKVEELDIRSRQAAPQQSQGVEGIRTQIADLATRIESLSTQVTPRAQDKKGKIEGQQPEAVKTAPPVVPPVAVDATKSGEETKKLYDTGYNLYRQGKYAEGRQALEEYIKYYPDTPLTDNAHFWIGESYYNEGQYEKSILAYDKIVREFQKGDKVPSALLKQAFAFDALGDQLDAKILLKKLIKEYSDSEQAAVAKRKLEVLGE